MKRLTTRYSDTADGPTAQWCLAPGAIVQTGDVRRSTFAFVELATVHRRPRTDRSCFLAGRPTGLGSPHHLAALYRAGRDYRRAFYRIVSCNNAL